MLHNSSTLTCTQVKLPAGPHWRNDPESLEDCEDEFLWAFTGIEQDSNGIVKPLLYYNNGSCINLVEYPRGSCQYYIFNGISDEIFKIHHPTNLDDLIEELGKPGWKGIKMESTQGENGSKIVYLDEMEGK